METCVIGLYLKTFKTDYYKLMIENIFSELIFVATCQILLTQVGVLLIALDPHLLI